MSTIRHSPPSTTYSSRLLKEPARPLILGRVLQVRDRGVRCRRDLAAAAQGLGDAAADAEPAEARGRAEAARAAGLGRLEAVLDGRELHLESVGAHTLVGLGVREPPQRGGTYL